MTLAGYYNRQGHFDKTIEALEERAAKEPNNPEVFYTIAAYYWDEAYRDFKLKDRKEGLRRKGMTAVDHALQIKGDYVEAIIFKGLLLRLQANLEKPGKAAAARRKRPRSAKRRTRCARPRLPARRPERAHRRGSLVPTSGLDCEGRQGVLTAFFCLTSFTVAQ